MRFIGSKNLLLEDIETVIDKNIESADTFCDLFSGTATVARYFKSRFSISSNDILYFSYCLQRGTIENDRTPSFDKLKTKVGITDPFIYFSNKTTPQMEELPRDRRFFQNNYAPTGGRMYITDSNALRFDYVRNTIEEWYESSFLSVDEYFYLVACAVEGLPFVSNIRGTYGAYAKTWDKRSFKIYEPLKLEIISNGKNNQCFNEDGVELLKHISGDILYVDPPYNERQYSQNYHVLETAARYDYPALKGITGQRVEGGEKSDFCSKSNVESAFTKLMENARYKHIIISYSTEGLLPPSKIEEIMKHYGKPETFDLSVVPYRRFKSRNDTKTGKLSEILFYIEKSV